MGYIVFLGGFARLREVGANLLIYMYILHILSKIIKKDICGGIVKTWALKNKSRLLKSKE